MMRTTLDIDDDVLAAAKDLAKAEGKTAGQVISDLARRALTIPSWGHGGMAEQAAPFDYEDGFPLLPYADGPPVTSALVRRLQDEIDLEDAIAWDHDLDAPRVFESENWSGR